ncbi:MAG: DUF2946 family protein [Sphingomonas sp.]
MPLLRTFAHSRPVIAAIIFACAMLARLAVPSGYMIGADAARGLPTIEICTGHGAATLANDTPTGSPTKNDPHQTGADHFCAFAGASVALDTAPLLAALPPVVLVAAMPVAITGLLIPGRGLAAPPPPKTGPPALF